MFNRRIKLRVMGGVVALGLALSGQAMAAFTAQEAAKLEADGKATLAKFEAQTKGADAVLANAKGILVCPSITKGGFIFGLESGECVLTKGAATPLYYGTSALKAGFLAGIENHAMILVLNTDEALAKFTGGAREWELGVDASLAVAKARRWRHYRYDQSEEGDRCFRLRRERAHRGCVLPGLAVQEARRQVRPGDLRYHIEPGAACRKMRGPCCFQRKRDWRNALAETDARVQA